METMQTGAIVAAVLIGVVILFQIGLAAGAPWGSAAWGGQHSGRLPGRLRLASVGAAVVLSLFGWILLGAAGVTTIAPVPQSWLGPATWVATGYFALGTLVNFVSRSRVERLWGPMSLAIAACCLLVSLGAG